jgi:hypothetical protein
MSDSDAFETQFPETTPTPGPSVMYEMVTPAPIYEDAKSMSGLEIGIFATAVAVGIIILCLLMTVGKRMG